MMWAVLTVLAIAGAMADDCCSPEDKEQVQLAWNDVWGSDFASRRIAVAQAVFADLFESNPAAVSLFKGVNGGETDSPEFKAHCVRVVNGLDTCINLLDNSGVLNKQLAHLNAQHLARDGVKYEHFKAIGESFSKIMPQVTSCFNPHAFRRCFGRIGMGIAADLP